MFSKSSDDIRRRQIRHDGFENDIGVDLRQPASGGRGFRRGFARVRFVEEELAL